jgi:uncharacterized protein with von Willebrand factor type A (vWA) domain
MNVLETTQFDHYQWDRTRQESPVIQENIQGGIERLCTYPDLMEDVYNCLYKTTPKVREKDIPASHALNRTIMEETLKTSEWRDLHSVTQLDPVASAIGSLALSEQISIPEEDKERAERLQQLETQLEGFGNQAESLQDLLQQDLSENPNAQRRLSNKLKGTQKAIQVTQDRLNAEIQQSPPPDPNAVRRQMRKACKQAADEIDKTNEMMSTWGTDPGELQRIPAEEKLALAQRIRSSSKLKQLSELVGRFQRIAIHKQKTKAAHASDEVVGIELGSDLARVLPVELAKLHHPVLKREFYKKFTERELMQYRMDGKKPEGKGPILCMVDSSGSMQGSRELWSKAVALGLLLIARRQKRHIVVGHFGNADVYQDWMFREGKAPPQELLDCAELFFNSGTNYQRPLEEILKHIETSEFKKADLIFITDGECNIPAEFQKKFNEAKKMKEFRVYSVLIGSTNDSTLKLFSDEIIHLTDLSKDGEALDLVFGI